MPVSLPLTSREEAQRYRREGLWPDQTLIACFLASAARNPDKIAIIDGERRVSYGELRELVDNVAGNLIGLGLEAGDVVALQTHNCAEMPIIHLACNRAGLLYMPVHDSWRETELAHLLKLSRAKVYLAAAEYRGFRYPELIDNLRRELPDLSHLFTLSGVAEGWRPLESLTAESPLSAFELDRYEPHPDLPAHIMLSGGTTALSKISRFSSNDLHAMLEITKQGSGFNPDDRAAALAPAGTGATGYVYPILMPLLHGATTVILDRWGDPEVALRLIIENECTYAVGIPTQLTKLVPPLEKCVPEQFARFRCFINAGAPLPYETGLKIETLMGCTTHTIYGSTDGGCPTCTRNDDPQEKRLRTVGRVAPGVECELWDGDSRAVPVGERGEVVWRSPHKSWGYLGDDAQTAVAFTGDRFYRSGDLGEFDEDGYLRIVGRIKDMILRGGRNIFPALIEDLLMKHPAILDASVAAMPDPELGERACAFIILREGQELTFEEMVDFLKRQNIAVWQLPERLEIVEDFPRGPGGKVTKANLTALVTEKLKKESGSVPEAVSPSNG